MMLFKRSIESAVKAQPEPATVRPIAQRIQTVPLEGNELVAYQEMAKALGFRPAALLHAEVLAFLKEWEIKVYDFQAVASYLRAEARKVGTRAGWWWRPLRPQDASETFRWGDRNPYENNQWVTGRDFYDQREWSCRPYHLAVPLRVLLNVQAIEARFAQAVRFFVTEVGELQRSVHGDPFIAVVGPDMPRIVFDCWDEPGFTG